MGNDYTNKIGVDTSGLKNAKREIVLSLKEIAAGIKYAAVTSQDFNSKTELLTKNIEKNAEMEEVLRKELEF